MQEITLAGLYRANFFKHAAFYGGTALRIFHGLNRFSEDLDFALVEKNQLLELLHAKILSNFFLPRIGSLAYQY
jgi:predicted nucleotidyltransferase component of viral defense system